MSNPHGQHREGRTHLILGLGWCFGCQGSLTLKVQLIHIIDALWGSKRPEHGCQSWELAGKQSLS